MTTPQFDSSSDLSFPRTLNQWYTRNARDLPWRKPGTSAWAILLSEVMSQQTPVARVHPKWEEWLEKWPTPVALTHASKADILRVWDTLGYPRRALRLQECAQAIVDEHNGEVPASVAELEALPGIGQYTARAVAAFYYGLAVPVVDTNVRRVYGRLVLGQFLQPPPSTKDLIHVAELLPALDEDPALLKKKILPRSAETNVGDAHEDAVLMASSLMELGATVCTARNPQCDICPVRQWCQWQIMGCPEPSEEDMAHAAKRVQKFSGTDRQVRGKIMALLRENPSTADEIDQLWTEDKVQLSRSKESLLTDGLIEFDGNYFHLPR